MTVLITGSRDFKDWKRFQSVLDSRHASTPISLLIHGGARGADSMGAMWAEQHQVNCLRVAAKWDTLGPAAGPARNEEMLGFNPTYFLAFPTPNSVGTYDMIERLEQAGIPGMVIS